MLSNKSSKCVGLAANLVYWARAAPLRWSATKRRVVYLDSKMHLISCVLSFCVIVLYEGFLIFRTIQAVLKLETGGTVSSVVQAAYAVCTYAIPIHFQLNTFHLWKSIPVFMNSYLDWYDMVKKDFLIPPRSAPFKNGSETLFKVFYALGCLINFQNAILLMVSPHKTFFLSSLMPEPRKLGLTIRLLFLMLHSFIWLNFWSQILFYGHILYSYAFPGIFILGELRRAPSTRTIQDLRRPDIFIKMYRTFQVEQMFFNYCLQNLFFPGHKVLMGGLAVLSTYGAIKVHSPRAILMGFAAFTSLLYLSILFRRLGRFFEVSSEVLHSWQGQTHYMRAFLRSCKPLSVNIGNYYIAKKTTVLCMWGIIINMTINLLLSF
ncbi:unnamed protein product [Allacma fusca]|uniref:Uncharacterized protein n=1 Tax=Allacma fusca TaxID=39272 RepID=A0A8J2PKW5_9HEXA|nr:unnamed protein product [Allacma fusca]